MNKLLAIALLFCLTGSGAWTPSALEQDSAQAAGADSEPLITIKEEEALQIIVRSEDYAVVYALNQSQAAKELYNQLPLTTTVENFSTNEKIFSPPEKVDTSDAPLADGTRGAGQLAYYEPWGDVVMFYGPFSQGSSLYGLGEAVSGQTSIEKLIGMLTVTAYHEGDSLHE